MNAFYNKINQSIENHIDDYMEIVKYLYEHPELGLEEYKAQKLLSEYLENAGFDVQTGVACTTDFVAKYKGNKEGPTIAFMCNYDALPQIGHGCGHNHVAAMGIASGIALKEIVDEVGGTVCVIGTPGEENFGGKITMVEAGVFDEVDVALLNHPGTSQNIGGRSMAIYPLKFEFFGKNAHGCHPQDGASALDGACMTYIQINLLRQFVEPKTYIHGIIKDGGFAANVIPAYASLEYYFRAPTMKYALEVANKAIECAKGAALATNTTLKTSVYECAYDDTLPSYSLSKLFKEKYELLGLEDIDEFYEDALGSTDAGAVSYVCPTLQAGIKIAEPHVQVHSKEMAEATISEMGKLGLINGAKAMSYVACDLLSNPDKLLEVKEEFKKAKGL